MKQGLEIDRELIERCKQKDVIAQGEVYRLFAPRMYGVCLRFSGNTLEADDFLQEGFLRVFNQMSSFRHEGSFEGWIRRIIINTAINLVKREMKYVTTDKPESYDSPENSDISALSRLSHQELLASIRQLPAGYRTVFNLYVIEGYTHKEIAQMLEISENTSKSQLFAAKRSLRKGLTKLGYGDGREG
ncbi:MAG: sigma-70 family RNA polymerase sigma factor [Bacteroidales bacterium]|nr:sigma-70 family RNA polymerase sigma factor [Bacteroidales bacterium]